MPDTFKVQISVPAQGQSLKVVGNGLSSTFPEGREEETDPIQVSFSANIFRESAYVISIHSNPVWRRIEHEIVSFFKYFESEG
jgi:hypothetical protein